jgi:UDP-glucose-4-epimerase GalE
MNLLVTGGAGYIGSHFCKLASRQAHHQVTVLDNLSMGKKEQVLFGPLEVADLRDRSAVREVVERVRPDAIVHFGAKAQVGESVLEPALYFQNNTAGTLNLAEAALDFGVERFVFSSTCATYGNAQTAMLSEDHPQNPINPYGTSKLLSEKILLDFHHTRKAAAQKSRPFKVACLRYFNVSGADPQGEVRELHEPETHLIPLLIQAFEQQKIFRINGDDYATADGTCIRDYVDVMDLAAVHLAALDYLGFHELLISNVGAGKGYSVKEVLDSFKRVYSGLPQIEVGPRRPGDPAQLVSDSKYFRSWCQVPFKTLEDSIRSVRDGDASAKQRAAVGAGLGGLISKEPNGEIK